MKKFMGIEKQHVIDQIWSKAKGTILEWQGGATELFVLDIPHNEIVRVLEVIKDNVKNIIVVIVRSSDADSKPYDEATKNLVIDCMHENTYHKFSGELISGILFSFYIWINPENETFDVEIVLWNDQNFLPIESKDTKTRFGQYIYLAEKIRGSYAKNIRCVLCEEINSDVRDLFEDHNEEVIIW